MTDDTLPANLGPNAFAGTADDYARFRPPYPPALLAHLLSLTRGRQRLLDLACGPGRIALALAKSFEQVIAVDIEPQMIAVGQRLAAERGVTNISWHCARAEDLEIPANSIDLVTIGEAFHRLDQVAVLRAAGDWLRPRGLLATMGGASLLQGVEPWHGVVRELAEHWTRDVFADGWALARPGALNESGALARRFEEQGFTDVVDHEFAVEHVWTIAEIAGYLRSTSVCSLAVLGARRSDFESALRTALLDLNPAGLFHDTLNFGLTVAFSRGPADDT